MWKLSAVAVLCALWAVSPIAHAASSKTNKTTADTSATTTTPAASTATGATTSGSTGVASTATSTPRHAAKNGTPSGSFSSEAAAKAHCPSDTVLWGNSSSKVLHYSSSKSYGKTKSGGYMCESEATKAGYHIAKGEKHT